MNMYEVIMRNKKTDEIEMFRFSSYDQDSAFSIINTIYWNKEVWLIVKFELLAEYDKNKVVQIDIQEPILN